MVASYIGRKASNLDVRLCGINVLQGAYHQLQRYNKLSLEILLYV